MHVPIPPRLENGRVASIFRAYLLLTCDRLSRKMLTSNMKAQRKALSGRVEPEILLCEQSAVWSKRLIWWLLGGLGMPVKSVLDPNIFDSVRNCLPQ